MPTVTSGIQNALTESGTATSDGMINLSTDGHYLTVTGYNAAVGTATIATSTAPPVNRVIGRVDSAGNVDTSTQAAIYSGDNIRGAITTDGSAFWIAGGGTAPDRGLYYVPFGSSSATNLNSTISAKDVGIFGSTLYASTSTGTNTNVVQVGATGTLPPTPRCRSRTSPVCRPAPAACVRDDALRTDGLGSRHDLHRRRHGQRPVEVWARLGHLDAGRQHRAGADDYTGLTAVQNGSTVTLFATLLKGNSTAGSAAQLVTLVDSSGYLGTLTGTPTLLTTAGPNQTFAGVAIVPVAVPNRPRS